MEYFYKGGDNSEFSLVDVSEMRFNANSINESCYKIIWAKDDEISLGIDGCRIFLKKGQLLFATPLNDLDLEVQNTKIVIYSFNREFYCIRDHDAEVSCNGFLFLGSSMPIMVGLTPKEEKSFNLLYDFFC